MSIPQEHDYIGLTEPLPVDKSSENEKNSVLNLKETELGLGLPGSEAPKRKPASNNRAQVIGWPPMRSFRKNTLATNSSRDSDVNGKSVSGCLYVKVSMDGAPYLRKIDLKTYSTYAELSSALEKMFSCFTIGQYGDGLSGAEHLSESGLMDLLHSSEYALTYEDRDGDWMLVGDVPWEMFADSCRRLRITKGSDATGLAPRTTQKCKSQNYGRVYLKDGTPQNP